MKPQAITIKKAAAVLAVSERTIRRAVKAGELHAIFSGLHRNRIAGITLQSVEALKRHNTRNIGNC